MEPDWEKMDGLIPCVTQDYATGRVLMVAYVTREALERTRETGRMHYYSRSRARIWMKGETSGHVQDVVSLRLDCDGDAFLALVHQTGPACHTGADTCFSDHAMVGDARGPVLSDLADTFEARKREPRAESHTSRLLEDENLRLKKVAEEAAELILGCAKEDRDEVRYEAADLLYHALVACAAADVTLDEVLNELAGRRRPPTKK